MSTSEQIQAHLNNNRSVPVWGGMPPMDHARRILACLDNQTVQIVADNNDSNIQGIGCMNVTQWNTASSITIDIGWEFTFAWTHGTKLTINNIVARVGELLETQSGSRYWMTISGVSLYSGDKEVRRLPLAKLTLAVIPRKTKEWEVLEEWTNE